MSQAETVGTIGTGGENTPLAKRKRRRIRKGNFANYGKPSFPATKAYPFEWGRVNGS